MYKRLQYAIKALEHTDELLDEGVVGDKQIKQFEKILLDIVLFNAGLDGVSKKDAINMFEADMEEIDDISEGSLI